MDAYTQFYIDLPQVILAKMKHHSCGHIGVLKGMCRPSVIRHSILNVLKSALLHWHVLHILKFVLAHSVRVEPKRPYATDAAVTQELQRCQVTVEQDGVCHFGR